MYNAKNLLITGSAGFIGSNFVRYYLETHSNIKVVSLDKLTYAGSRKNLDGLPNVQNHEFIQGDICDRSLLHRILHQYQIDTIVHFAAESHVDRSITGPEEFVKTNVLGTFELLETARQYWLNEQHWGAENCRFHHISTDEVFGTLKPEDPAFTENSNYAPNSPYSATKAGSDHLVRAYFHTYGLPVTTSNCSNNYGPYQHPEKLIPTTILSCLKQNPIPVYGDGGNIRDWLFVKDHCSAIDAILARGKIGEIYNIGGNAEYNNLELVKCICYLMDKLKPRAQNYSDLISFVKDRPGHDFRYAMNNAKINKELSWSPAMDLETGLKETIKYFLQMYG